MNFEPRDTDSDPAASGLTPASADPGIMSTPAPDLAALVGSRLCHDLISPLGAIGNGVELLTMTGLGQSPELQLIAQSVASANARIKFFRIAFGQARGGHWLARAEVVSVLEAMSQGGRLQIEWQVGGDQPRALVKLAFLSVLCLEQALPWGGKLEISEADDGWRLQAQAPRTRPDPALWARLDHIAGPVSPAQVQFALLPHAAMIEGRRIEWEIGPTGACIRF